MVPAGTDPEVIEALQRKYAHDPSVKVIVDRREGSRELGKFGENRRSPVLRRRVDGDVPGADAPGIRLEAHLPAIDATLADAPIEVIITRAAAHDPEASAELRWRCHQIVSSRLRARLRSSDAADKAVPAMMDKVQEELAHYVEGYDFNAWLVEVVDNLPIHERP